MRRHLAVLAAAGILAAALAPAVDHDMKAPAVQAVYYDMHPPR